MHDDTSTVLTVERRIDRPVASVQRTLISDALLVPGTRMDCAPDGCLIIEGVLRATRVPGSTGRLCRTTGQLVARGRRLADVEIEVGVADPGAPGPETTVLVVRPLHRHTHRWRAGRRRRYANAAAACAEQLSSVIVSRIPADRAGDEATVLVAEAS